MTNKNENSGNNELIKQNNARINEKKQISEPTVEDIFESQKEFIVLGLVGKTGSGVSTVSNILNSDFDELQLPHPCEESHANIEKTEYRLLYNFANKHWRKFYKIKTSALILTSALCKNQEEFREYLSHHLLEKVDNVQSDEEQLEKEKKEKTEKIKENKIEKAVNDLYNCIITFNLKSTYIGKQEISLIDHFKECKDNLEKLLDDNIKDSEYRKAINVNSSDFTITMSIFELNTLFYVYKEKRMNKDSLDNFLFYEILWEYIYVHLAKAAQKFWFDLSEIKNNTKTIILQDMGNNLRITKNNPFAKEPIVKDGYIGIAELINISIKLLRDYKYKKVSLLSKDNDEEHSPEEKRDIIIEKQAFIVIDSIKNPYESMYLKRRYSNYYLIAIYTGETCRKQRLEQNQRLEAKEIEVIDVTEQLSEFKKLHKKYQDLVKNYAAEDVEKHFDEVSENANLQRIVKEMNSIKCDSVYPFIMQNIQDCIESADIFINNKDESLSFLRLKKKMMRYACLIMYPGLVLPTAIERCMQIANTAKLCSGCISRQVGAVLTDSNYNLMATGWNQQPENQVPCLYRSITEVRNHCNEEAYSDYENDNRKDFQEKIEIPVDTYYQKPELCSITENGRNISYCFKDIYNEITNNKNQIHPRALHAEETAFLNLNRTGSNRIDGGYLFTTSSPCELCSKKAMYMGITKIYYVQPYPGISDSHVLSAGEPNSRPELELYTGAIGRAYTQLYTPIIPKKDELELWMGHKVSVNDYPKQIKKEDKNDE